MKRVHKTSRPIETPIDHIKDGEVFRYGSKNFMKIDTDGIVPIPRNVKVVVDIETGILALLDVRSIVIPVKSAEVHINER